MNKKFLLALALGAASLLHAYDEAAEIYIEGLRAKISENHKKAAQLFQRACLKGRLDSCTDFGLSYLYGRGVLKDTAKGIEVLQMTCDGGDGRSCSSLGFFYGPICTDCQADPAKAAHFYQKACDADFAKGCAGLGELYQRGYGVEESYYKAVTLYEEACDGGYARGCSDASFGYDEILGEFNDPVRAQDLGDKACDLGSSFRCVYFGEQQVKEKNFAKAKEYYKKCLMGDSAEGCEKLKKLID